MNSALSPDLHALHPLPPLFLAIENLTALARLRQAMTDQQQLSATA